MIYFFIGPPASGKGTQAQRLAESLKLPFLSVGALLRDMSKTVPAIQEAQAKGEIVSNECIQEVYEKLSKHYPDNVIIDGAMRTAEQVEMVCSLWAPQRIIVFWLEVPDEIIRERVKKRHLNDGTRRTDDRLGVTENRITIYRTSIQEVIDTLHHHHIQPISINGNQPPDEVYEQILQEIHTL